MARVSKEVRLLVVHLSMSGMSQRDIQKLVGCSLKTVNLIVQRFRDDGTVADRPRRRRRVTSEEEDRLIVAAVVDEPFLTADEIRRELGLAASGHTIRLRLHEAGLTCFNGQMRRSLTAQHKEIRLEFATEHAHWDVGQWLSVVFTNESTMSLKWDPNRGAWRALHSWNDPLSIRQLVVSGHVSINLFAIMTYEGLGPLVRITGSATPEKCSNIISNVLVPYLLDGPFKEGDYVLQLDATPTYTSEEVQDHIEQLGISVINWPPKSEDLNPIKSVWEIVKKRICRKRVSQPSPDKLWALIEKEWNVLRKTPDFVRGFYTSLPQRIADLVRLNGAAV
uniref:Putative transposable element n=1 Tax=Amblyomma aureolatum TaxID=187763 RepID=A0A1E1XE22_9ACAR